MANKIYRIFKTVLHTTYSCNMSCKGCVTLNDHSRTGVEPYEDLIASWERWSKVLDPYWVVVFGGEPLMHPRFKDLYREIRRLWPETIIMLPTNGLLLRNMLDKEWLDSIKPIEIRMSMHRPDLKNQWFKQVIAELMGMYPNWKPMKYQNEEAATTQQHVYAMSHDGIDLSITLYNKFRVPYRWEDGKIRPYDNDPDEAVKVCVSQENAYIYKGLMYKCFPYPNLQDVVPDFHEHWPAYKPFAPEDDLTPFFANLRKSDPICRMCPTAEDHARVDAEHATPGSVQVLPHPRWISKLVNS